MNSVAALRFLALRSRAGFAKPWAPTAAILTNKIQSSPDQIPVRLSSHESHSGLWYAEKVVSGGLLAIIPAAFVAPSPVMDSLLALVLVSHIHWGVEAIVTDYIRPSIFGAVLPKVALGLVYALTIAAFAGLLCFNFNDVGLTNGMRMAWKQL